jgi:hypothetical protein
MPEAGKGDADIRLRTAGVKVETLSLTEKAATRRGEAQQYLAEPHNLLIGHLFLHPTALKSM